MKNIKEKVITIFKHLSNNTFRRKIRKKKKRRELSHRK